MTDVPYKYTGRELDTASNLYFYESRYDHPIFGRFISPDTLVARPGDPQDLNRYAQRNPVYESPLHEYSHYIGKCGQLCSRLFSR